MLRRILAHGVIAGLVVGIPLFVLTVGWNGHRQLPGSVVLGYTIMLIALSAVFTGIKNYRDRDLGGVIGFGAL